jgi:hypothetical protein
MDWEVLKNIVTSSGAAAALYVYYQNSRLRRAEWLASLYEKFFERPDLKTVREILDCAPGQSAAVDQLVAEEPAEFTDYLNFFEFVAVLRKTGQLSDSEIEDLFRYYLDCLGRSPHVRRYISEKGYERLDSLLRKRTKTKE